MSKNFGNRGGGGMKATQGNVTHVKGFGSAGNFKQNRGKKFQNKGKDKKGKAKDFNSWKESIKPDDKGKTNWNELKTQMKTLREERKQNKKRTFYDSYQEVKKLWEKLRLHTLKPTEKEKLCQDIMNLVKGNIKMIVKSHDMARIVQWLIKLGTESVREQIFTEISEDMVNLTKNKYTKHTVKSLLQHSSSSIKKRLVEKCYGNIYNLTCNKVSAPLVDEMFKAAGSTERNEMIKEFFKGVDSEINLSTKSDKDEVSQALLNKSSKFISNLIDKGHCLEMHLIHSVIESYYARTSDNTMIESLKPLYKSFITSKDGVTTFARILYISTAKEKKNIVKEFKNDLIQIVTNEYSSLAFRLLIDSVDDTVLIKKALVPPLIENFETVVKDSHGRKAILYLIVHRNQHYFTPAEINSVSQWDGSEFSKKDKVQKMKEIHAALLPPLIQKIKINPNFWFSNSSIAMVLLAILQKYFLEATEDLYTSIAEFLTNPLSVIIENEKTVPLIEHPGLHMIIKKIIAIDKDSEADEKNRFSYHFVKSLNTETVERFLKSNRGCFTLVAIIENCKHDSIVKDLIKKVNACSVVFNKQNSKGSEILKKCVQLKK